MQQQDRITYAEHAAYMWACGEISGQRLKGELGDLGFQVDLRQPDTDNTLEVLDVESGEFIGLEC